MLRHKSTKIVLQCNDCRKSPRIIYTYTFELLFHLFQIPVMNCVCFFKPDFQTSSRLRRSRCDNSRTLQTNFPIYFRDRKLSMLVWLDFGAKTATSTRLRLTMIWNTIGERSYANLTSLNHDSGQVISGRRRGRDCLPLDVR